MARTPNFSPGVAGLLRAGSPVPTRVLTNGELTPPPQTPLQGPVGGRLRELAGHHAARLGVSRRAILGSASGMAAAFLVMNQVRPLRAWPRCAPSW